MQSEIRILSLLMLLTVCVSHRLSPYCSSFSHQGTPTQEGGPTSGDPSLPQVYAPPPSYPPPGQGPPTPAGRLPALDFSPAHPSSDYQEHHQLRVFQGSQHEGPDSLSANSTVRSHTSLTNQRVGGGVGVGQGL